MPFVVTPKNVVCAPLRPFATKNQKTTKEVTKRSLITGALSIANGHLGSKDCRLVDLVAEALAGGTEVVHSGGVVVEPGVVSVGKGEDIEEGTHSS